LPFLPDEFFGLTDGLHTIKKMGEFQGPDYETIKKRIPPSLEEIRDKLMHVTKKDDISAYFNKRLTVRFTLESVPDPVFNYLAEFTEETGPSIFKQIKALLASPQGESK
jgi:hypothetical protein